jgi:tetratricopeptide (TPR) repeat protein
LRPPLAGARPGAVAGARAPDRRGRNAALVALAIVASLGAVVAVFFWLPARVAEQRAAVPAAAPPVEQAPAEPALSPEELEARKNEAESLLAGLLTLEDRLRGLNVADWTAEDWQRYRELSEDGDNAFLIEDYTTAVARYAEATSLGEALIERAATTVESALATAAAAVAAGDAARALEHYGLVLTIDPDHAAALAGRARAERLPEVLALVARAADERERGELEAALASYREALAIDPAWPAASDGVAETARSLRDAEFERALSAGFGALAAEDFAAAEQSFNAALKLRPGAQAAQDGLAQAAEAAKLNEIALVEVRALAFERRELWDQAIELYRAALESDPTLLFAQAGLERAGARAGLDAKLVNLIENPTLLFQDAVLADARMLLVSAEAEAAKGPRLTEQISELGKLVELASKPISVQLTSDQLTEVTLYRVGNLGAFAAREVELRPGTYTVIGSRNGYRDVRQTFTVRPGRNLAPISVVCVEPI